MTTIGKQFSSPWRRALGLGAVLALVVGVANAKGKPPPEPPPTADVGLIYFWSGGIANTMETDGTRKTAVGEDWWLPSRTLHDGRRWCIQRQWNEASQRDEYWAVPAEGTDKFQLTFDTAVEPNDEEEGDSWANDIRPYPKWATHSGVVDGKVTYLALRYDTNGDVIDHGLQEIYIDWTNKEATAGASMVPIDPLVNDTNGPYIVAQYDWNPDGTAVAYVSQGKGGGGALRRIDKDTEGWSDPVILTWYGGKDPQWSPDGTRIAHVRLTVEPPIPAYDMWKTDIWTISPVDGSGHTVLVAHSNTTGAYNPRWSPSGSHLAYTHKSGKRRDLSALPTGYDVYRITKTGGDTTNLTADLSVYAGAQAWVDE